MRNCFFDDGEDIIKILLEWYKSVRKNKIFLFIVSSLNKQNINSIFKCKRRNIVSQQITASSVIRVINLQSYFGKTTKVILFFIIDNYEEIFDYYLKKSSKPTIFNNLFVRTLTYNNNKFDDDFEIKLIHLRNNQIFIKLHH